MNSGSSWQVFSLLCSITLISTTDCHIFSHVHARNVNGLGDQSFVDSLFEKYGTNKSMDLKQFEALLKELKVGSMQATESDHGHHEHHESESESSHGNHDTEEKGSDKVKPRTFTIGTTSWSDQSMSNSLNASVIDPNYPVRSIYAQQWVNIITSLVFYTILYFSYFSCTCKLILKNPIVRIAKRIVLYCIVLYWGRGVRVFSISSPKKPV